VQYPPLALKKRKVKEGGRGEKKKKKGRTKSTTYLTFLVLPQA